MVDPLSASSRRWRSCRPRWTALQRRPVSPGSALRRGQPGHRQGRHIGAFACVQDITRWSAGPRVCGFAVSRCSRVRGSRVRGFAGSRPLGAPPRTSHVARRTGHGARRTAHVALHTHVAQVARRTVCTLHRCHDCTFHVTPSAAAAYTSPVMRTAVLDSGQRGCPSCSWRRRRSPRRPPSARSTTPSRRRGSPMRSSGNSAPLPAHAPPGTAGLLPAAGRAPLTARVFGEVVQRDYRVSKVYFRACPDSS